MYISSSALLIGVRVCTAPVQVLRVYSCTAAVQYMRMAACALKGTRGYHAAMHTTSTQNYSSSAPMPTTLTATHTTSPRATPRTFFVSVRSTDWTYVLPVCTGYQVFPTSILRVCPWYPRYDTLACHTVRYPYSSVIAWHIIPYGCGYCNGLVRVVLWE